MQAIELCGAVRFAGGGGAKADGEGGRRWEAQDLRGHWSLLVSGGRVRVWGLDPKPYLEAEGLHIDSGFLGAEGRGGDRYRLPLAGCSARKGGEPAGEGRASVRVWNQGIRGRRRVCC